MLGDVMSVDRAHQDQLWLPGPVQQHSSISAVNEANIWMASEIINATERITKRMLRKIRAERSVSPLYCDQMAASILSIRRDIQSVAARIVDRYALEKDERIDRAREALGMDLKVAAAFLLDMLDEPGRAHGARPFSLADEGQRRRTAVYASHIRRALRPHGLETALITVRSRGYLISPEDAIRIRKLWGEWS